ncbi:hypothetical protein SH668x_001275 [Planctomicrobium sp. SH668]|uniref:hypothetical protein n=1 Tax=Planctomicrobium sp. SH668 TaxID=3448126 RepID=UPI003F5C8710
MLLHPEVAYRNCEHCLNYVYSEEGVDRGQLKFGRDGEPLRRPRGTSAPCRREGHACPKGTPEVPKTLSKRNRAAWMHFRKCKLTGNWPDDELVIERALALEDVLEEIQAIKEFRMISSIKK